MHDEATLLLMFVCCHRVILFYISLGSNYFTPQNLMFHRVVSNALRITVYQTPLKSFYILYGASKFSLSLVICAAWFLKDEGCSFHQGVHLCTSLTQKQSSKYSAEATAISSEGRTQSSTWPKNFTLALLHVSGQYRLSFQLLATR